MATADANPPKPREGAGTKDMDENEKYRKEVKKILQNESKSIENKSEKIIKLLKKFQKNQFLQKERETLKPANDPRVFGGGETTNNHSPVNDAKEPHKRTPANQPSQETTALSHSIKQTKSSTPSSESSATSHTSNGSISDSSSSSSSSFQSSSTSPSSSHSSHTLPTNTETPGQKPRTLSHMIDSQIKTSSLELINLFASHKKPLDKKTIHLIKKNASQIANVVDKHKLLTLFDKSLHMKKRGVTLSMPLVVAIASISLNLETLFNFFQLFHGRNNISKMPNHEKKILAVLLKSEMFRRSQIPCEKIWNLKK